MFFSQIKLCILEFLTSIHYKKLIDFSTSISLLNNVTYFILFATLRQHTDRQTD